MQTSLFKYISLLKCTTLSLPVQRAIILHPNEKSQSWIAKLWKGKPCGNPSSCCVSKHMKLSWQTSKLEFSQQGQCRVTKYPFKGDDSSLQMWMTGIYGKSLKSLCMPWSPQFSVLILLIMQYKNLLTPYTVILFTEMLNILCMSSSKRQQKGVAASTFHLFCLWIKKPSCNGESSEKRW